MSNIIRCKACDRPIEPVEGVLVQYISVRNVGLEPLGYTLDIYVRPLVESGDYCSVGCLAAGPLKAVPARPRRD